MRGEAWAVRRAERPARSQSSSTTTVETQQPVMLDHPVLPLPAKGSVAAATRHQLVGLQKWSGERGKKAQEKEEIERKEKY